MSKVYNSALQARVEQFLQDRQISQAKAAPLMGISQTALSQYRRSSAQSSAVSIFRPGKQAGGILQGPGRTGRQHGKGPAL